MLLEQISPKNLLSFGTNCEPLRLGRLNVVIGPNGSGKSNLLDVIDLLRSLPDDLARAVREAGGIHDLLWKGAQNGGRMEVLEATLGRPDGATSLLYTLAVTESAQRLHLVDERIAPVDDPSVPLPYYTFNKDVPNAFRTGIGIESVGETIDPERSILAQRHDPERYPEITWLAETATKNSKLP